MTRVLRALVIIVLIAARPASADDAAEAKELYRRATAHFSLGRFHEAATEYEAAFEKHPDPVILYNIAQSYRLAGDKSKALFFYKSYLQRNPRAPNRGEVEERIGSLEQLVAAEKRSQEKPPNSTAPLATEENEKEKAAVTPMETKPMVAATQPAATPVYKKWWLWTIVGAVVVGGAAVGLGVGLSQSNHFGTNLPAGGPGSSGLTVRY